MKVHVLILFALMVVTPASALPVELRAASALEPADAPESRTSCAVSAVDKPSGDVQPFTDPAAVGARLGTSAATATVVVYPYACSYVVFQVADPNRPVPRGDLLPEDAPGREIWGQALP